MKPRPVLIEWNDSAHLAAGTWLDREAAADIESCSVVSVAWLIGKDRDNVVIAQSITEADDVTGTFVIPRSCVCKLKRLRGAK